MSALKEIIVALAIMLIGCKSQSINEKTFRLSGKSTDIINVVSKELFRDGFSQKNGSWHKNNCSVDILEINNLNYYPEITQVKIRSVNYNIDQFIMRITTQGAHSGGGSSD